MIKCIVPENIHSPPTERIGNSWGVGGSQRPNNLSKCMKLDWNFQRGGGWGGSKEKYLPWGRYGQFLEPHNIVNDLLSSPPLKQAPLFRGRKLCTVCSPPPLFLNISRLYQLSQYHCSVTLIHYGLFTCWKFRLFCF